MAKQFACKDMGMDCSFTARGKDEKELMNKIGKHAEKAHNIKTMDAAMTSKVKSVIKEA